MQIIKYSACKRKAGFANINMIMLNICRLIAFLDEFLLTCISHEYCAIAVSILQADDSPFVNLDQPVQVTSSSVEQPKKLTSNLTFTS
jgi:hypothetical protein